MKEERHAFIVKEVCKDNPFFGVNSRENYVLLLKHLFC